MFSLDIVNHIEHNFFNYEVTNECFSPAKEELYDDGSN